MRATSLRAASILAAALLATLAGCGGQRATEATGAARADLTPTYLALGDSVAFGLDPRLVPPVPFSCFSCASFTGATAPASDDVFVGYPDHLGTSLGLALVNASCPGETAASFGARVRTGQAAICAEFKEQDWLHAGYDRTQQRYALDQLALHPRVELVTLQLGANDVLDLVAACGGDSACVGGQLGGVLAGVHASVSGALSSIRSAGYAGPVAVVGYYAPTPAWTELVAALNQYLALAASGAGAVLVDPQALYGSDPCAAGLLLPLDAGAPAAGCDIHPSDAGARLIAGAIASALGR